MKRDLELEAERNVHSAVVPWEEAELTKQDGSKILAYVEMKVEFEYEPGEDWSYRAPATGDYFNVLCASPYRITTEDDDWSYLLDGHETLDPSQFRPSLEEQFFAANNDDEVVKLIGRE